MVAFSKNVTIDGDLFVKNNDIVTLINANATTIAQKQNVLVVNNPGAPSIPLYNPTTNKIKTLEAQLPLALSEVDDRLTMTLNKTDLANDFYNKTTANDTFNPKLTINATGTPLVVSNNLKSIKTTAPLKITNNDTDKTVTIGVDQNSNMTLGYLVCQDTVYTNIVQADTANDVKINSDCNVIKNLTVGNIYNTSNISCNGNMSCQGTLTAASIDKFVFNPYWIAGFCSASGTIYSLGGRYSFTATVTTVSQLNI